MTPPEGLENGQWSYVDFEKRSAIKSQVLADWTEPSSYTECPVTDTPWQVYCDGA
jgi:ribonuclease HI